MRSVVSVCYRCLLNHETLAIEFLCVYRSSHNQSSLGQSWGYRSRSKAKKECATSVGPSTGVCMGNVLSGNRPLRETSLSRFYCRILSLPWSIYHASSVKCHFAITRCTQNLVEAQQQQLRIWVSRSTIPRCFNDRPSEISVTTIFPGTLNHLKVDAVYQYGNSYS